jgi:hypothetical protein
MALSTAGRDLDDQRVIAFGGRWRGAAANQE